MAVKDPKARRGGVRYTGGHVSAARGLLDYLFQGAVLPNPSELSKPDARGRTRLKNTVRAKRGIGGKQLIVATAEGHNYQLHYGGTLKAWQLNGVPLLNRGNVYWWKTARGTKNYV
jgi:hypothetical protein